MYGHILQVDIIDYFNFKYIYINGSQRPNVKRQHLHVFLFSLASIYTPPTPLNPIEPPQLPVH